MPTPARPRAGASSAGTPPCRSARRLEELDRKRRRALDAAFLIRCWTEVSETTGQLTSLEDIQRQQSAENKVRCAAITNQLMRISQRLDPVSWGQANGHRASSVPNVNGAGRAHNTKEIIEKFSETLEEGPPEAVQQQLPQAEL